MRSRGLLFIFVSVMLFAALISPIQAHAADSSGAFNLITSPLPISISGAPGTLLNTEIRLKNNGSTTERLKVTLMKFSANGEDGKPAIADRAPGDDYFDWVTFTPSVFDAAPNEWKTIKMSINMPKSAAFGYYYAAAFGREGKLDKPTKGNLLLGSAAVLVLVEAKVPNAERKANILSFVSTKKTFEFLPATFNIKMRNDGNVHLVPSGDLIIKRGGKEIAKVPVNSAGGNILPGSSRTFTGSWNDGYPYYSEKIVNGSVALDKNNKPLRTLSWNTDKISHLRYGKYTAHLLMVYDDGTKDVPLEATVSFWVIPWRLIGLALLILIVPAWAVYFVMHRRIKKIRKSTQRV
jgi:hypothetical protein